MRNVSILTMVLVAAAFMSASATIINVPANQPNIQAGINASSNGDTVRVAPGTYVENINFSGKNIVVGSWFLDAGDTSYISSTIIDGNQSGSVVTFENGEDNTAIITGFTIQNGIAEDGGGIFCHFSSPTISNNTISGNSAGYYGGGICCSNNSNPTISNNTIRGNSAVLAGGGILCTSSNPTINYNTISANSANRYGGGIYCYYNSNPTINYNTISGNSAGNDGGGIGCYDSSPPITNTVFWGDSAPNGPEIFLEGPSSPVITYCDVQGGWAGEGNIDCDPMFCDPENGNFYLDAASCCLGAGENGEDIGAFGVGCGIAYAYLPGDANMYNGIWPPQCIGSDVTYLVGYFRGQPANQPCELDGFWASADANGDCNIIGSDVTRLVNYFRGNVSLLYCPDYEPLWLTPDDLPEQAPDGWPNCETPIINSRVIPAGSVK